MSDQKTTPVCEVPPANKLKMGWKELYLKEDWWAIWIALGLIIVAVVLFYFGITLKSLAVKPPKWSAFSQLTQHFLDKGNLYVVQFIFWLAIFSVATRVMGFKLSEYVPSFLFVYVMSVVIFCFGSWDKASDYNLEPPLVALALGLLVANLARLPKWMDAGFRVEFYIKVGIILLGATLPLTMIAYAGPIAIVEATIISVTTFLTVYFVATRLFHLDRRLAACLGAGASVCGVSGTIAIAGAVGAKKEHPCIAITLVIIWAIIMIFFLPFVSKLLNLHPGVAGAWIGTSEFADAAGFAAAQAYGNMVGNEDAAVWAFTLMKVIGRDIWIGLWAFIFAIIAVTKWERPTDLGQKPNAMEIWWRFPKFVLGFFVASIVMTVVTSAYSLEQYSATVKPMLIGPIKTLRTWTFIMCFFSIGLTTRFRELTSSGITPAKAFTAGVIVNVILGFLLNAYVFADYWSNLTIRH